jgi:hypothetical protein
MTKVDPELFKYAATDRQRQIFKAVESEGSHRKAAKRLECLSSSVDQAMALIKKQAALKGYSPQHDMTHIAPDPFVVKGTSTYYDEGGKPRAQWVKTTLDQARQQAMLEHALEVASSGVTRVKPLPMPKEVCDDLLNLITITDAHVGALARKAEAGEDWNLEIARDVIIGAFKHLVSAARPASTCVIAQLGDMLHYDGLTAVTPTSKHILDASGRPFEMIDAAIDIMRAVIDIALQRHRKVVVLIAEGNHDMGSAPWLRRLLQTAYEREPRVEFIVSENPYYAYQFGKTMLFWHHSHCKRLGPELALLAATRFSKIWGETVRRYGHTGDKHHVEEKEYGGMSIRQHGTLAAKDAWAARGGYDSLRSAQSITYHSEHGRVGANEFHPSMLLEAA